jgi:DNA-binding XRE family transcriptional regulator
MSGHWEVGRGAALIMFKNAPTTRRIVADYHNGISVAELELMYEAMALMSRKAKRAGQQVLLITIGDALFDLDYAGRVEVIREAKKRITKEQGRAGIPQHLLEVIELLGSAGFHSHLVCIGNAKVIHHLRNSAWLAPYTVGPDAIQDITERKGGWIGVFRYLSEERTNPANRSRFRRVGLPPRKPATKLPGAGDRVRVSDALKSDLINGSHIRPFTATPWKQKSLVGVTATPFSPHVEKRLRREAAVSRSEQSPAIHVTTMTLSGQVSMFPDERPISRIRDYGGGFMPPSIAEKIEFHRRRLGFTQAQLAALIGICQPTFANVLAGRYPLSGWAANRLRETLEQRQEMAA